MAGPEDSTGAHGAEPIGIVAFATYLPAQVQDAAFVAAESGISEGVVRDKFGNTAKHRADYEDQTSAMALHAARTTLARAEITPSEIDLILDSGSMHKDFHVWSAANRIQHLLGATNACAFELAALCTTNVPALKVVRDFMTADPSLGTVLICGGHRTADLIDYRDHAARFLFNLADSSLSEDVTIPAGGTRLPTSGETLRDGLHTVHASDTAHLKTGLDGISEQNCVRVVREAVERSSSRPDEIAFLAINHMEPAMHRHILSQLGLREDQSIYRAEYGHIGAPDQVLAQALASERGLLHDGDLVAAASAGLGFTWGATALRWERGESA